MMEGMMLVFLHVNVLCSMPLMQTIIANEHEWHVPNEPGWERVIAEVESVRSRYLESCASARECRKVIGLIRDIFLRYPVSAKYFDVDEDTGMFGTIFRWG